MHCRTTRTQTKGFTLIELLVVIAIIAILAAILFPVFAQAREQARKTVCLSNVKQISLGNMMYIQDYDETFEFAWGLVVPGTDGTWLDAIMPYVKNGQPNETGALTSTSGSWHFANGLWHCPSDSEGPSYVSYTTNALETGAFCCGLGPDYAPETLAALNAPASLVMIAESNKPYNIETGINGYDDTGTDLDRCLADLGADKTTNACAYFFRDWIHNQDYTDVQWTPITGCPAGPAYTDPTDGSSLTYPDGWNCKYPAFRHNRTGQKSGISNFAFSDGHAKSFRYGAMKIENWFPSPSAGQLQFNQ
jgi:prepilin-type N-terminal cleavage/methylation domain-containing protein